MGHSLLGGLLVIWLLGAPVVWALASLINTPSMSASTSTSTSTVGADIR